MILMIFVFLMNFVNKRVMMNCLFEGIDSESPSRERRSNEIFSLLKKLRNLRLSFSNSGQSSKIRLIVSVLLNSNGIDQGPQYSID